MSNAIQRTEGTDTYRLWVHGVRKEDVGDHMQNVELLPMYGATEAVLRTFGYVPASELDALRAENEALRKGLSAKELENVLVQADGAFRPGEAVIGPNRASFLAHAVVQALGRDAE